jgi:hypothetical protein
LVAVMVSPFIVPVSSTICPPWAAIVFELWLASWKTLPSETKTYFAPFFTHTPVQSASVIFLPSCSPAACFPLQLLSLIAPFQVCSFWAEAGTTASAPMTTIAPNAALIEPP